MKYTDEECREVVKSLRPVATHSDGLATIKDRQVIYSWKQAQQLVQMLDALEERLNPEPTIYDRAFDHMAKKCLEEESVDMRASSVMRRRNDNTVSFVLNELSQPQKLAPIDPALINSLGINARELICGGISWESMIARVIHTYEEYRPGRLKNVPDMSVVNGRSVSITEVDG